MSYLDNDFPSTSFFRSELREILKTIKELEKIIENFVTLNSIAFADPIEWDITKQYSKNTVVLDENGNAFLSKDAVPKGIQLNDTNYWLKIFDFINYQEVFDKNLTFNVELNTTQASSAYAVDDWLLWNNVLYKVTTAITINDDFIIGTNITQFTVEDFIKTFMTWTTATIQQYKNDIDSSELTYKNELATTIASTTASLQAQLNAAIAGVTVDSEIINGRISYDGVTYNTIGDAIRSQVSDLHDIIDHLTTTSDNRFNPDAITDNTYIAKDGTIVTSASFWVTDYIPVNAYEKLYFWGFNETTQEYEDFYKRFLCAYDSSKNPLPDYGINGAFLHDFHPYTVESGVAYIRVTVAKSTVANFSRFYLGIKRVGVDYLDFSPILKNQHDVNFINNVLAYNFVKSTNLFDTTKLTEGHYLTAAGSLIGNNNSLNVTDYMPVNEGDVIYGWNKATSDNIIFRFITAYDANKNSIVSAGSDSALTPPYTVPSGVKWLRITIDNNYLTNQDIYIGVHPNGVGYEPYTMVARNRSYHAISNGDSILAAVKYCYANNIPKLIIGAGTYNIINEYKAFYGNSYFDDYVDYSLDLFDAGIWLHDIELKFEAGSKVIANYTGNNQNVIDNFSAFATGNNVIIDGLTLDAVNLRYGIHSDYNSGDSESYYIVRNSDLKNVRPDGNKCIGAGLGKHVFWLFENTIFRTTGNYYAMRIHNNVSSEAESKIIVKDCYIDGNGYFKFNAYSTSTKQTIIQLCGCSYKTNPVVDRETPESNDNFTLIAWNNQKR